MEKILLNSSVDSAVLLLNGFVGIIYFRILIFFFFGIRKKKKEQSLKQYLYNILNQQ